MKVSIIIPAYNVQNEISRCLRSMINQVYKNIEIIVVDDASTDNTRSIIKKYAEKDNRIIPFYQTINKGVSAARNTGLMAATGDYIIFVDSDDEMIPSAIRRLVDVANKYNSDFVDSYHLFEYTKPNGKIVHFTENKVPKNTLVMGSLKDNPKILKMATYITGKLIKKDLFDGITFDENLRCYEDMVLEHKIKSKLKNYVFLNRVLYIYYQRPNSLVNSLGKNHLCFIEAAKMVKEIYSSYDKEIKDEVEAMLVSNMFLTLITKVIKNDDTIENNVILATEFLKEIIKLFPEYQDNNKINNIIRKNIVKFIDDKSKLEKFIRKTKKINFINLYFLYLSITHKYKIKSSL